MVVENIMFLALGVLSAGLLAILIMPSIWRRAVRLTKRRIEAATPMTLNEFRADKDKLRAEFAIATRRLELTIEALREKRAGLLVQLDGHRTEIAALKSERDEQFDAIRALQVRETELVARIRDLERETAELAARLRQQDRAFSGLDQVHHADAETHIDAEQLSGDYRRDVEDLLMALGIERQRGDFLEEQAKLLLSRLEKGDRKAAREDVAVRLRETLAAKDDPGSQARLELREAEARIASAENRLSALLAEPRDDDEPVEARQAANGRHLAEELSLEEEMSALHATIASIETEATRTWQTPQFDTDGLRDRLDAVAASVSRTVYAADATEPTDAVQESLFDKVLKFAPDADERQLEPADAVGETPPGGSLSDRMDGLRQLQVR